MAKRKKGILRFIWGVIKWFFSGLFSITKRVLKFIYHLIISAGKKAKHAKKQSERPSISAVEIPFELMNVKNGNLKEFENKIYSGKSTIGLMLGARGSGKSALGMRLLENIASKHKRKVCAMGFDPSTLPRWISSISNLDELKNGVFVLVDEGGITFSSRNSMSNANKLLSSLIMVARHKDISVVFISQNSSNLEVNAIRQADYLLLRKPSLLQLDFERKKIGDIYKNVKDGFEELPNKGKHATYIYSDEFEGFVGNELPSFWTQKTSKSFSSFGGKKVRK